MTDPDEIDEVIKKSRRKTGRPRLGRFRRSVETSDEAVEIARTRGKLIFLTVIVDNDGENRAVIDMVFRDRAFLKISKEFVILYANNDDDHRKVRVRYCGRTRGGAAEHP